MKYERKNLICLQVPVLNYTQANLLVVLSMYKCINEPVLVYLLVFLQPAHAKYVMGLYCFRLRPCVGVCVRVSICHKQVLSA
jgi:hypothetical protein